MDHFTSEGGGKAGLIQVDKLPLDVFLDKFRSVGNDKPSFKMIARHLAGNQRVLWWGQS